MDQTEQKEFHELQVRSGHSRAKKTYSIAPFTPSLNTNRIKSASIKSPISIIPKEAKGRKKGASFESQEPTSPKVSCIGQIKLKKKQPRKAQVGNKNGGTENPFSAQVGNYKGASEKAFSAHVSNIKGRSEKLFSAEAGNKNGGYENPAKEPGELVKISKLRRLFSANKITDKGVKEEPANEYPSLGQMKHFTSCRESSALANFYSAELPKKNSGI